MIVAWLTPSAALGQTTTLSGTLRDETGGALPGVSVELRTSGAAPRMTVSDPHGLYTFDAVRPGAAQIAFTVINFATATREATIPESGEIRVDAVLHLALNADVVVTGRSSFANLADVASPAENLIGIAHSASQGAVTAAQLDARPMLRAGEVLETVPGVIISQHSGEGKANQYYLRGFDLDHGTDFATTVAGMPVNLPTHGHGQGYSDLNFLITELVSGVQFSKGPYFADQSDFATAGAATINYVNALDKPIVSVRAGEFGFARTLAAASPRIAGGHLLAAIEVGHNDGPWVRPDDFRTVNGIVRFSRGDTVNGFSLTGMGYRAKWNSTDQIPQRAIATGLLDRFGALDTTDGGSTYRYSGSLEWQRGRANTSTRVTAYGIGYDLALFSNFTFFLDDEARGDQFEQVDRRFVAGARVSHRRLERWFGRGVQNTFGLQIRNDDIGKVGLYHTQARRRLAMVREDSVLETATGAYVQNEIEWSPWLRSLAGLRADGYRFDVDSIDPVNSGTTSAGLVSPKGGAVIGPFRSTELYVNGGFGFHSNDARGTTISRDPVSGDPVDPVTPLVRATGAEVGVRTVAIPQLQSSLALWSLNLDSELVFVGDAGTTEAGRPSHRYGIEWANYYRPRPWLVFDGDLSLSRSRFTDQDAAGERIPGAVESVVSLGATMDSVHGILVSMRLRYFGPRPLVEDNSVRSPATRLTNLEAGYRIRKGMRLALEVLNLFDSKASDIDYYYRSRLAGERAGGIDDIHTHPTIPRSARVNFIVGR
jgi:TonB dependent receptor-like, beta-barrel/TonB-dependent Receptor Plug Domain/Carboxypeptidase regulatory-like domain